MFTVVGSLEQGRNIQESGDSVFRDVRSCSGGSFEDTPWIVPTLGHLDSIKRLVAGDVYIGRGSRQRSLGPSRWGNPYKVAIFGRDEAIRKFACALTSNPTLSSVLWTLSGARLVCHCTPNQACHADSIIASFRQSFPSAYDRDDPSTGPPSPEALEHLAKDAH